MERVRKVKKMKENCKERKSVKNYGSQRKEETVRKGWIASVAMEVGI